MAEVGIEVKGDNSDHSESLAVAANVYKPIEALRYSKYADKDSISVAYFESKQLFSDENVVLEDHSLFSNYNDRRNIDEKIWKKYNELTFISKYKDIIITFVEGRSQDGQEITPFFYKQKSCENVLQVRVEKITNQSEDPEVVNDGHTIVKGEVFFNYKNKYNSVTGEYTLYYINTSHADGTSKTSLLNPTKAIEEANYENIETGKILYSRSYRNQYYSYRIILPNDRTIASYICSNNSGEVSFYVKELEKNCIYLKKPKNQSIKNEWFAEVNNGEVYSIVDGSYRKYSVPEYKNQGFLNRYGYLNVKNKECSVVNNLHIQLPYKNVYSEDLNKDVNVYLYDVDNKLIGAEPLSLVYIDESTGIVRLEGSVPENVEQIYKAEFSYKTESFVLNEINLNPYMNPEAINETYHVYVKPNEDAKSIEIIKESKSYPIEDSWLYLGSINYEEDYDLERSLSFDLKNNERFTSAEDAFDKNPYVLQSKYGYGHNGQKLQKNNIVIVDVPFSYEREDFYTEKELYKLFKRKLKPATNLVINYVKDSPKVYLISNETSNITVGCTWEGLGTYKLYSIQEGVAGSKNTIGTYNDIPDGDYKITFTDVNTQSGHTYTYSIEYNDVTSDRTLKIKAK